MRGQLTPPAALRAGDARPLGSIALETVGAHTARIATADEVPKPGSIGWCSGIGNRSVRSPRSEADLGSFAPERQLAQRPAHDVVDRVASGTKGRRLPRDGQLVDCPRQVLDLGRNGERSRVRRRAVAVVASRIGVEVAGQGAVVRVVEGHGRGRDAERLRHSDVVDVPAVIDGIRVPMEYGLERRSIGDLD